MTTNTNAPRKPQSSAGLRETCARIEQSHHLNHSPLKGTGVFYWLEHEPHANAKRLPAHCAVITFGCENPITADEVRAILSGAPA